MYKFAIVGIEPINNLKETADIVGEILSNIKFHKDENHIFDEVPAYVSSDDVFKYALLGHADGNSGKPIDNGFYLRMYPKDRYADGEDLDLSEDLAKRLNDDGRLRCWT